MPMTRLRITSDASRTLDSGALGSLRSSKISNTFRECYLHSTQKENDIETHDLRERTRH